MKLTIPDDWNGKDWQCLQVEWPDSPQWTALLTGLLSLLTRGAVWQETGDLEEIPAVQQIAWQIWDKNYPFHSCEGEIVQGEIQYVYLDSSGDCDECEECEMGCSIPYGSLRYSSTGKLQYLYCGAWYDVPGIPSGPDAPPDNFEDATDNGETGDKVDSTACAMADALVNAVVALVTASFTYANDVNPFDFFDDMSGVVPGIDLSWSDVMRMWFLVSILNPLGLQGETLNPDIAQQLRCSWDFDIFARNTGITQDEYERLKSHIQTVIATVVPPNAYLGEGGTIALLYMWALYAIGYKDANKITFYAQPTSEDCACYTSPDLETEVTSGGWYWGVAQTTSQHANGGDTDTQIPEIKGPVHDVYGVAFKHVKTSGADLLRFKRIGSAITGADYFFFGNNSDNLQGENGKWLIQVDPDIFGEVSPLLPNPAGLSPQFLSTDVVASPSVPAGSTVDASLVARANAADGVWWYGDISFRYLYNVNSPSHS